MRSEEQRRGIHKLCDGVYFVTKSETMAALRHHYEESASFMGMKIMTPKLSPAPSSEAVWDEKQIKGAVLVALNAVKVGGTPGEAIEAAIRSLKRASLKRSGEG